MTTTLTDLKSDYIIACPNMRYAITLFRRLCRYCADKRINFKCINRGGNEITIFESKSKVRFVSEPFLFEKTRGFRGKIIYASHISKMLDDYEQLIRTDIDFINAEWETWTPLPELPSAQ